MSLTTVTLNPAIDEFSEITALQIGEVNRVQNSELVAGGKGINVATAYAQLGGQVQAYGFLGGQNQAIFQQHLQQFSIKDHLLRVQGLTRKNIKLIDQFKQVTELNYPGFLVSENDLHKLQQQLLMLTKQDYLLFAGSLPQGLEQAQFKSLLTSLKEVGFRLVADCSGQSLKTAISIGPELIKPNLEELETYFNCSLTDQAVLKPYVAQLLKEGVKEVLLSLGEDGVIYFNDQKIIKISAPKVKVKSSVGAGDSLLAAYLWATQQKGELFSNKSKQLIFATALASLKVQEKHWQALNVESVNPLLTEITCQVESW